MINVYLDTNVFVYAMQGSGELAAAVVRLLQEMERLSYMPVTSELTLAELLCKNDLTSELHKNYSDLLVESGTIRLEPVTREILLASAELRRAGGRLKLQDAIHVATATNARCRFLVTNDAGIRAETIGVKVLRPGAEAVTEILSAFHG